MGFKDKKREDCLPVLYLTKACRLLSSKEIHLVDVVGSHVYGGKYCGMAEMSGPYDPNVDPQTWIAGLRESEGIIPMRWIVTKDVDFTLFVDLKYRGRFVTELRHANT